MDDEARDQIRNADRERFERDPDVLAFRRPYRDGETAIQFPAGTIVIVDRLFGAIRRWAVPPPRSGCKRVRID